MIRRLAAAAAAALLVVAVGCADHDHEEDAASDAPRATHAGHEVDATADAAGGPHSAHDGEADDGPAAGSTPWIADTDHDALFTVDCGFSHRAPDDPIVHPGHPGASHSHDFFGSEVTDASSTGGSLLGTATTCEDTEDTAAYWTPTLSVDGSPVEPTVLRAYYRARPGVDVRDVVAPPLGLAMIAGDPTRGGDDHAHAAPVDGPDQPTTTTDDGEHEVGHHDDTDDRNADDHNTSTTTSTVADDPTAEAGWGCGLSPRRFHVEPPTDCTARSPLTLRLRYPDCWDGERLDSPDHRAHVARSVDGACPATHPVLMTELQVSIVWPVTGEDAAAVTLSSGGVAGAHGDFLNGWEPDALADHVELCIHAEANCTIG